MLGELRPGEQTKDSVRVGSPPPEPAAVRVSSWKDINPPVLFSLIGAAFIIGIIVFGWQKRAVFKSLNEAPVRSSESIASNPLPSPGRRTENLHRNAKHPKAEASRFPRRASPPPTGTALANQALFQAADRVTVRQPQEANSVDTDRLRVDAERDAQQAQIAREIAQDAEAAARKASERAQQEAAQANTALQEGRSRERLITGGAAGVPVYTGPRFGTILWEGEVRGTELITIEDGTASVGTIHGSLPGVPVLIQPVEPKKVGIASPPSPENNYKGLVFRVSGHGLMRLTFQWSLP